MAEDFLEAANRGRKWSGPITWSGDPKRPKRSDAGKARGARRRKSEGGGRWWTRFQHFATEEMRHLTRVESQVWIYLFAKNTGGTARESQEYIAAACGCSRQAVRAAVNSLVQRGLLEIVDRGCRNKGATIYRLSPAPIAPEHAPDDGFLMESVLSTERESVLSTQHDTVYADAPLRASVCGNKTLMSGSPVSEPTGPLALTAAAPRPASPGAPDAALNKTGELLAAPRDTPTEVAV